MKIKSLETMARNWAIDTSAKVMTYAPLMATMETYNGMEPAQILKSRASVAMIDSIFARVYGKGIDYARKITGINPEDKSRFGKVKNYLLDTSMMIGTYTPVYATILKLSGADNQQIKASLLMGAGIAALTARPYVKNILTPWRNKMGYEK